MDQGIQRQLAEFAWHVLGTRDFAITALQDEEVQAELAARGVSRHNLECLAETADEVSRHFYNDAKPA